MYSVDIVFVLVISCLSVLVFFFYLPILNNCSIKTISQKDLNISIKD